MAGPVTVGKSDHWGSRFGFIMAAVGSSVGLGNLWRFPYIAGEMGGSAFILIYLGCILLFGFPVLMAEYALGRHGQRSSIASIRKIVTENKKPIAWVGMGWLGAIASLLLFSFYIVISAWVFDFVPQAFLGGFSGFDAAASGENFGETTSNKLEIFFYMCAFLALNVFIVARGVHGGIEKAAEILMPLFFVMLIGMVIFAVITGDAARTVEFLFTPDFSKITFDTFMAALGQAFFSLSVGSCVMFTYGAYLTRDTNIPKNAGLVASADTLVALVAGFAIFPIVFSAGLNPEQGPGLFFVTMPVAFGGLPSFVGGIFFTLALFAAFTSSISLLETGVSWLEDQKSIGRVKGAIGLGVIMFFMGIGYIWMPEMIDHASFLSGDVMLPLGGVLIGIFAGWVVPKSILENELGKGIHLEIALVLLRFVVPIFISIILILGMIGKFFPDGG
ncbi:sodium-dependent transporter [Ponticaulis sp.]|uniref:sodium-dependent transporter n=1 Tax=Ponticaulis sp. TaxID=2020902 RepID=UPI000B63EF8A|nr:sodium-dependent transporter [Ponticaulis sp.]MAI90745.1 sodium-dependent transporter [Ponticaulis sp.]OUX98973.1 MAG: sodium-dependent transporter [Hyphomonadaceae bacterium TMED5]